MQASRDPSRTRPGGMVSSPVPRYDRNAMAQSGDCHPHGSALARPRVLATKQKSLEPSVYHPTQEEFDHDPEEWRSDSRLGLERGIMDVAPSREYPGQHLDPLLDCLIVFPSFKSERTNAVIARVDPSLLAVPGGEVIWSSSENHTCTRIVGGRRQCGSSMESQNRHRNSK